MKKLIVFIICISVLVSLVACNNSTLDEDTITVMSYNVRVFSVEDNAIGLSLHDRVPFMKDKINTYSPDVIGMQEVCDTHMRYFTEEYDNIYDYVIQYRSTYKETFNRPEAAPIFYKKEKFDLLDSGSFWLSETPDKPSIGWDSKHYRVCTYVKLKVKKTGQIMLFYNVHMDWMDISRPKSIELILNTMELDYPCVLMGDFNLTPANPSYEDITAVLEDSRKVALQSMEDAITFNDYAVTEGKILDYFYLSKGDFEVSKYEVSNNDIEKYGMYASDHFPILAYVKIIDK